MPAQTIEHKKQQYSRQLALYTFRQWNAVRESQSLELRGAPEGSDGERRRVKSPKESMGADDPEKGGKEWLAVNIGY